MPSPSYGMQSRTFPLCSNRISKPFVLDTDASQLGIGAILSQTMDDGTLSPIAFASRTFTKAEKKWPTREIEAFAIIWSVNHFRYYLLGRKFTIRTDHQSLQWIHKADKGKIARWAALLAEYDCEIHYRKGSSVGHVDYLSRTFEDDALSTQVPESMCPVLVAIPEEERIHRWSPLTLDDIRPAIPADPELPRLIETKSVVRKNNVYATCSDQIYIPAALRDGLLDQFHLAFDQHLTSRQTYSISSRTVPCVLNPSGALNGGKVTCYPSL